MASTWVSSVVALEVSQPEWPASDRSRSSGSFAPDVCGKPLWGAPRIHGELIKLGFEVAQPTVSKYMVRRHGSPSSQGWKTFLRNHNDGIASVDFLVVPTLMFQSLFAFVVLGHGRRKLLWIGVTTNTTAEWLSGYRS
jgi:hypothetical protein